MVQVILGSKNQSFQCMVQDWEGNTFFAKKKNSPLFSYGKKKKFQVVSEKKKFFPTIFLWKTKKKFFSRLY